MESQDDRTAIMEEHMKRVKQEIYYTECRVDARRREIASEEHIKKISEMEAARIQVQHYFLVNTCPNDLIYE